ncbi:hypothetical protein IM697_26450 [Streptomyces ferrugineus]|uniref:Uncharacterized protein n=1 Tax=Streptomyces ferrugineus TaxID=1413221 RepID=A0A7M2SCJ3_9ACTN|nr:hypothetical protein [Streptomyces ferrugineus]QOV33729.1 hypothetical protein IM697_26450 [Streptomyces ferrugineus]
MGTSLTPEFWERFTLLLFAATGVTCVLAALFDTLVLRRRGRRARRRPTPPSRAPHRPETAIHHSSVRC